MDAPPPADPGENDSGEVPNYETQPEATRPGGLVRWPGETRGLPGMETPVSQESPMPLLPEPGQTFGHYRLVREIGRGGMGIVFEAEDTVLHRSVALKVLAPQWAVDPLARRRFLAEARTAAGISSPHVVTVYAVEEVEGWPFLVMELVRGRTVQELLDERGRLPLALILRIGWRVAAGLAAAHRRGVIHRDVKPGNVLIEDTTQRVKLTDFGLARAIDDARLTRDGIIVGTPAYMAPEQVFGGQVDHRADLFSLGSLLYALAVGEPPFDCTNTLALVRAVADSQPPRIRQHQPQLPLWFDELVARLHSRRPSERFNSADEVARKLRNGAVGDLGASEEDLGPLVEPSPIIPVPGATLPDAAARDEAAAPPVVPASASAPASTVDPPHDATAVLPPPVVPPPPVPPPIVPPPPPPVPPLILPPVPAVVPPPPPVIPPPVVSSGSPPFVVTPPPLPLSLTNPAAFGGGPRAVGPFPAASGRTNSPTPRRLNARWSFALASVGFLTALLFVVLGIAWSSRTGASPPSLIEVRPPGQPPQQFPDLSQALAAAPPHSVVEIRSAGPFELRPQSLRGRALTIRAALGVTPRLNFVVPANLSAALVSDAPLELEGLDLRVMAVAGDEGSSPRSPCTLLDYSGPELQVRHCRLRNDAGTSCVSIHGAARNCAFWSSELHGGERVGLHWNDAHPGEHDEWLHRLTVDHCLLTGRTGILLDLHPRSTLETRWTNNTFVNREALRLVWPQTPQPPRDGMGPAFGPLGRPLPEGGPPIPGGPPRRLAAGARRRIVAAMEQNVFDTGWVLVFAPGGDLPEMARQESFRWIPTILDWHGRNNLYSSEVRFLGVADRSAARPQVPANAPASLPDWLAWWGQHEGEAAQEKIRYVAGLAPDAAGILAEPPPPPSSFEVLGAPGYPPRGIDAHRLGPGVEPRWVSPRVPGML
ncbi:MAG: serine/threonine-protein kinase [Pirellulales bacterium]